MARNKFNARKTHYNGHTFASGGECNRYRELELLQYTGAISDLQHPVGAFTLHDPYISPRTGKRVAPATYRPDFSYTVNGETIYEDYKGAKTASSILKRKIVEARHGVTIWFVYSDGSRD
jgi:hypothetical protein